jgi:hypothetical protein
MRQFVMGINLNKTNYKYHIFGAAHAVPPSLRFLPLYYCCLSRERANERMRMALMASNGWTNYNRMEVAKKGHFGIGNFHD